MRRPAVLALVAAAAVAATAVPTTVLPTVVPAPPVEPDEVVVDESTPFDPSTAAYREEYFLVGDATATRLHADLLRDVDVPWVERQPVVLVVSPYTNHNGSTTDVDPTGGGAPNPRFYDFLGLTHALERGYTFVQVDLPGFGGSSGCNDWGGPRERAAVGAAVEWAATQPWSDGNVALLGKSYDGWTGLMGMAEDPFGEHLDAAVSMEPVFSGYRYLFNDGVRFANAVGTPALFQAIDAKPGALDDSPEYLLNGAPQAWCYAPNVLLQQQDDEASAFWAVRDLVRRAAGSTVPLFLTQGFLETNTKPDAAFSFWNAMANPDNRAWFGQFDHVRGWDRRAEGGGAGDVHDASLRLETGRRGFAREVMAFLDEHLKGVRPAEASPRVVVQDSRGRYRAEQQWPPADAVELVTSLAPGAYTDGVGTTTSTEGVWSLSQPLPHVARLVGEPRLSATVTTLVPRTNLVVDIYDVDPDGLATLVNRGTTLVRGRGEQQVEVALYGQDWVLRRGHRVAVRLVGANTDWWSHVPTGTQVEVLAADVALPFLTERRTAFLDGRRTPRLEQHLAQAVLDLTGVDATQVPFTLPGRPR